MSATTSSTKSPVALAIDSNQLLSLCQRTREATNSLSNKTKLTRLRLTSLRYVRGQAEIDDPAGRCSDDLIELCELSRKLVHLIDGLQMKLSESAPDSIDHQIATQQLIYFTYEWCDRLAPELEDTFELANELAIIGPPRVGGRARSPTRKDHAGVALDDQTAVAGDSRVRDALLRLRQSMNENERLISTIANNIESTRATIEAIFDSLQSTKVHLNAGEANAIEAIKEAKRSNRLRIICWLLATFVVCIALSYLVSWLVRLFRGP